MDSNYQLLISELISRIKKVTELSSYEEDMVANGLLITRKELPSTKMSATARLSEIATVCSDYNYIINKLRNTKLDILAEYRSKYDHKFTVLTRQMRPSKDAIISEIHYTSPDLASSRNTMDNIDSILDFMSLQLSILDKLYRAIDARQYAM